MVGDNLMVDGANFGDNRVRYILNRLHCLHRSMVLLGSFKVEPIPRRYFWFSLAWTARHKTHHNLGVGKRAGLRVEQAQRGPCLLTAPNRERQIAT